MIPAGQLMPGTKGHSGGLLNLFLIIAQSLGPQAGSFGKALCERCRPKKVYEIRGALWWVWLSGGVWTIGCSLSMWNGCGVWLQQIIVLDWSVSRVGLTSTPEECVCLFFFPPLCVSYLKTLEIQSQSAQFGAAICFYFNERWNWLDKWLYLKERSLFVCFWSKYCHKIRSPLGKWETVCRPWSSPFLSSIEFPPTKDALLIDWATHFLCIKVFAVWGAQFVSALVNRLKAAASP